MKIHNILGQIQFTNNYSSNKTQKTSEHTNVKDSIDTCIYAENEDKDNCIPISYFWADMQPEKLSAEQENAIARAAIFRDDELFDAQRDILNFRYMQYDANDVTPVEPFNCKIADDYSMERGIYHNPSRDIDTFVVIQSPADFYHSEGDLYARRAIHNLCDLNVSDQKVFSFTLSHYLHKKNNEGYSLNSIEQITDAAKLTFDNGDETVNYNLLDIGFELLDNDYSEDDVVQLMRGAVLKNKSNCEYYSKDLMYLQLEVLEHLPLETAINMSRRAVVTEYNGSQKFSSELADKVLSQVDNIYINKKRK